MTIITIALKQLTFTQHILYVNYPKHFLYYILTDLLSKQYYELDTTNYDVIFQMKKLGCKEVNLPEFTKELRVRSKI